jgi:Arc/MetJ-type ribon-helix-helix transcriptional regulator
MRTKARAVVSADKRQLTQIARLVRGGSYASTSAFVREALDEKLQRLREAHLRAQVTRYAAAGYSDEDEDLVAAQAFAAVRKRRRAAR